jgi:hypothetical protein
MPPTVAPEGGGSGSPGPAPDHPPERTESLAGQRVNGRGWRDDIGIESVVSMGPVV